MSSIRPGMCGYFLGFVVLEVEVPEKLYIDFGEDQLYLLPRSYKMQDNLDDISKWTQDNLMQISEKKSNFISFIRSKQKFSTWLYLNYVQIEYMPVIKPLGVGLDLDLCWETNTREICQKGIFKSS